MRRLLRRRRLAALTAALCLVLLGAGAPVAAADSAMADPSASLGAVSPSCRYALDAEARRACNASGSVAQPHPLSSYGLDVRSGFSLTDPGKTFMSALQSLGAALWTALLYLVKAALLLLEWAFSLDLTNESMPDARRSLARMHGSVFGSSWLLLGITLAGIWGMWNGLVRQQAVQTFGGLALTVALMVGGLVVISRPAETVGTAARWSNDAGLSVLAAGTGGDPSRPRQALARSMAAVFDSTVRNPWCALQFGSIEHCDARLPDRSLSTNAELWLKHPAQSWQRGRLFKLTRGDKDDGFSIVGAGEDLLGLGDDDRKLPEEIESLVRKAPERVKLQESGGTFPRLALMWTVGIGLLGAVVLLGWIGLRLLLAGAMTVLLLLLAPVMLIAPAIGEHGRNAFSEWAQRLIGALLAKLVFSIFLTVVLVAAGVFSRLQIGWFGGWLLQASFWWGVFLKRDELLGFLSIGTPRREGAGFGDAVSQAYYGWMLSSGIRNAASRALEPARAGAGAVRASRADGRAARAAAVQDLATERLDLHGRRALAVEEGGARETVAKREELQRELRAVDRQLRGHDEAVAAAHATGSPAPAASAEDQALLRHRDRLQEALADPVAREASEAVRHADRNRALTGEPANKRDLEHWRVRRATERDSVPLDDPRNLTAAGIDPAHFAAASPGERAELLDRVQATNMHERELEAATASPDTARAQAREAWVDPEQLRARTAEHRARLAQERRERRLNQGAFRRRR